jgi:hypothetical protein
MIFRSTKLILIAMLVLSVVVAVAAATPGPQTRHQLGDAELPEATVDSPYDYQFEADLRDPAPEFSVTKGTLPKGLTLTPAGLLSGTATIPGDSNFTVKASNGVGKDIEQPLTLQVVGAPLLQLEAAGPLSSTTAKLVASVNPRNLPTTAWFEYWPVSDTPQTPVWTPIETVASGLASVVVSTLVSELEPDTEYAYRVSAHNDLNPPPVQSATKTLRTPDSGLPPPVAGESFNLEPVEGATTTKCAGEGDFSRLLAPKQVTLDCEVDTTNGTVSLTASKGSSGDTQTALFWGGLFGLNQKAGDNQKAVLGLSGGLHCERRKSGKHGHGRTQLRARKGGGGRKLWGSGSGNYKTVGSHGAATVRGTIWLVSDRCDGSTHFKVNRGVVAVRDFVKQKTVILEAGDSYIAKVVGGRLP